MSAPDPSLRTPGTGTGRIRWEPLLGGNFDGYVGTRAEPVFKLFLATPSTPTPWALRSELLEGYFTGTSPDDLKAEAERWLEEFVRSLGAAFPAEPITDDQRFQVSEARDLLDRWDRERFAEDGYAAERTLADQVRALLAIVDQVAPETPATTGGEQP